jgi:hypothetical protein
VLFGSNFLAEREALLKKERKSLLSEPGSLEGWSAVVLVEYLAFVYAHDPVESDYEE